ncbi:hypothetical protein TAM4_2399 [Thermococcus sp. AM4]|nr:hypothetical protein TAM4_2399 [Thermococcus sp. AM4]
MHCITSARFSIFCLRFRCLLGFLFRFGTMFKTMPLPIRRFVRFSNLSNWTFYPMPNASFRYVKGFYRSEFKWD